MARRFISIRTKFVLSMAGAVLLFDAAALTVARQFTADPSWNAIVLFSLLSLFLFSAAFVLQSGLVVRPVRAIMRALEAFTPGGPLPEIPGTGNDEMRLLGDKFREIMVRVNRMEEDSRRTELKMIETEKLASVGTLASGVAHEINNPISGIEICVRRLRKHAPLDAKQEEYLDLISGASDHIKTVVRSLLAYVRTPGQSNELVDLRWVVQFALKLLDYRLQKKGLTIREERPDKPCLVWGIRTQLVQVAVNGIINAIDASFPLGHLSLSVTGKGQDFLLTIADEGSGLDPVLAGKVFDPFFTTKGREGTGLGLYVSYNIVTAHRGSISLKPREPGGATLEVLLPRAAEKDGASDPFYVSGGNRKAA